MGEADWTGPSQTSTLACVGARVECRLCWSRLITSSVCVKARDGERLGRARMKHSPARVGTASALRQVRLQHELAKAKTGWAMLGCARTINGTHKICGWDQVWLGS